MGLQLNPMRTSRPVRSSPRPAATAEAAVLVEGTTTLQHCGELGGVIGGGGVPVGMAAARVWDGELVWLLYKSKTIVRTYNEHRGNDDREFGQHLCLFERV
jgi:hypothetical protein